MRRRASAFRITIWERPSSTHPFLRHSLKCWLTICREMPRNRASSACEIRSSRADSRGASVQGCEDQQPLREPRGSREERRFFDELARPAQALAEQLAKDGSRVRLSFQQLEKIGPLYDYQRAV